MDNMDRVPKEVIARHAFDEASRYFANKIKEERKQGKVAVLVQNLMDSLFFLPCDKNGFPDYQRYNALHIPDMQLAMPIEMHKKELPKIDTTIEEIQVIVESPILSRYYDNWERIPVVFMWSGRCVNRSRIPIERLNVQELMRVTQRAIQNREGLIIDEALKNKIYK